MKRISLFMLLILLLNNTCVLAVNEDNLPIYDDFDTFGNMQIDKNKTGYQSKLSNAKNHYAQIQNNQIMIHINKNEYGGIEISKMLETPFSGGNFSIEYDFSIVGDEYLYSLAGLPVMIDSDGVETASMKVTSSKQGYTVPGDRKINIDLNSLKNTEWQANREYKIKIDVDLKLKKFEIYIDDGNGYAKKETVSGDSKFEYSGKNFAGFYFSFLGNKTNEAEYFIDNIKILTGYEYIYVSSDGDDSDDGSYEKPVRTLEKAYTLATERKSINNKNVFVRVKKGVYNVDENYVLGTINEDTEYKRIAFAPDNDSNVSLTGKVNIDIPELKAFNDEILIQKFKEDIKENYISGYNRMPLEISDATLELSENGEIFSSTCLANSGRVTTNACLIMAVYDKDGRLVESKTNSKSIIGGERVEMSIELLLGEEYHDYNVKTYLWDDLASMIPIFNMEISPEIQIDIRNSSILNIDSEMRNDKVELKGTAMPGEFITVKITNSSGNIIYLNQITADENGFFEYLMVPRYVPYGVVTLHVSSNGGIINE